MMTPMQLAIERARKTMNEDIGGPFGAAITDSAGNVIAVNSNRVLADHDPTAHAEITAIREACQKLGTHDLSGYIMHATGYPCPMCLSAMIWANMKVCYYGNTPKDAERIGFRDDFIYDFIKGDNTDESIMVFHSEEQTECLKLFNEYAEEDKEIY